MCGIIGCISFAGSELITKSMEEKLNSALDFMSHRGPDNQSVLNLGNSILGHARLSIIDSSKASNQPMIDSNGNVIVYNGEVYNYKDLLSSNLNKELNTTSDTEVVLKKLSIEGVKGVESFNGMYSFCYYDKRNDKYILARDRFGIKPLYYISLGGVLYFASEINSLLKMLDTIPDINAKKINEWLYYGNTLSGETLISGINKLDQNKAIVISNNKIDMVSVYDKSDLVKNEININKPIESSRDFKYLFEQAVTRQLVSDVPIGVFLSGGIDSSAITQVAARVLGNKLTAYTARFDYSESSQDLKLAQRFAKDIGVKHQVLDVTSDGLIEAFETLIIHHGAPFSDSANIPLYMMTKQVGGESKVILQGDGGDEFFGGYNRYSILNNYSVHKKFRFVYKYLSGVLAKTNSVNLHRVARMLYALSSREISDLYALLLTEDSPILNPEKVFSPDLLSQSCPAFEMYETENNFFSTESNLLRRMMLIDQHVILPYVFFEKVDISSMANSVEIRVPFLDNDLVNYARNLPLSAYVKGKKTKYFLRQQLSKDLPSYIVNAPKKGFSVPYKEWLKTVFYEYFYFYLLENDWSGVLNVAYIQKLYEDFILGRNNAGYLLWKILNFMVWYKKVYK